MGVSMGRIFTQKAALYLACAVSLSGCFNNMSSLEEGSSKNSQSNAILNDSGFANETGSIDTTAVLIGTYKDTTITSDFGILIDLQKSLLATLGASSLQAILDGIDTNPSMQARSVTVHIPSFGIKAQTTLGKIAAGNGKRLRNIMNIRPRLVRVDLTTSSLDVPGSPAVLQLNNSNKTVITYGGKIEGDYVRRMTVLIPFAGVNASFLPNVSTPNYGDGYPSASPQEVLGSVKLIRLTQDIAGLFNKLITNLPYGPIIAGAVQSDSIKGILQTKDSLALSVHYKLVPGTTTIARHATTNEPLIDAAYFININPANSNGPETYPFCHSGYDDQDQSDNYEAGKDIEYSHPLACECSAAVLTGGTPASPLTSSRFTDPCPSIGSFTYGGGIATPTMAYRQKRTLIAQALADPINTAAPTSGAIPIGAPRNVSDFVLSAE
jgi:hypothetical protein